MTDQCSSENNVDTRLLSGAQYPRVEGPSSMKRRMAVAFLLTALCLALSAPAFADLYNNGPTNGTFGSYFEEPHQPSGALVAMPELPGFAQTYLRLNVTPSSAPLSCRSKTMSLGALVR